MEEHWNTLKLIREAIGYSPEVLVKLNKQENQIELGIPYAVQGHAEEVYNRIISLLARVRAKDMSRG